MVGPGTVVLKKNQQLIVSLFLCVALEAGVLRGIWFLEKVFV